METDFNELKLMIEDARRAVESPGGLDPIQEVSAALFFTLGAFIDNLADRVAALEVSHVARLEPTPNQSLIIRS